jgi:acyl CoA:acetate/3-ketoacid CoA transferase alpha subunit
MISYWVSSENRYRGLIGNVGENGIKADVWYAVKGGQLVVGNPIRERDMRLVTVVADIHGNQQNEETTQANALLIAAAPDLLAALEDFVSAYSDMHWKNIPISPSIAARAHDAIAKATGSSP